MAEACCIRDPEHEGLRPDVRTRTTVSLSGLRVVPCGDAIDVLRANPLIGRPTGESLRELVIGRGARGYMALYRYVAVLDTVFVLAIRAQREAGYARP